MRKQSNDRKKTNAWKRYGAVVMAGVILAGSVSALDFSGSAGVVYAEEERVTLNLAEKPEEDAQTEAETEEPETEAPQSYEAIAGVQTGENKVVTTDVSDMVVNCMPSIVSINKISVQEVETYYYGVQTYENESAGSGIIIAQNDEELLIATNSHVVKEATELSVCFTAEAEDVEDLVVSAKVKGTDRDYELAVVAVQLSDIPDHVRSQLKIAALGSSGELKVGQAAIAIGNALGYGQSVTSGIISALDRQLDIDDFSQKVIMTDAAINFGNSGGALLNAKGEVVGINVAKEAGTGVDSMGYSIPIDIAVPVLERLVNKQTRDQMDNADRGYMGVTVVNVSDDAKELYNMPAGAFVYEVSEGSAGEAAGLKKGDIITAFDGDSVSSSDDLIDKMSYYAVGETITVEVMTANNGEYEIREVEVTLQKGAAETTETEAQKNVQEEADPEVQEEQEGYMDGDSYGYGYIPFQDGFEDYNQQYNYGFEMFPFGGMF